MSIEAAINHQCPQFAAMPRDRRRSILKVVRAHANKLIDLGHTDEEEITHLCVAEAREKCGSIIMVIAMAVLSEIVRAIVRWVIERRKEMGS